MSGTEFVFGVDLDGVCAMYEDAFRSVVAKVRGVDPSTLPPEPSYDFAEWGINSREEFLELHGAAVQRYRMFAAMPMMEGCAEALWRLSDAGVWIRIITHRLHIKGGHAIAVSDTVTWLDIHDVPYRDICFLGEKPQLGADIYVDDAPHNVEALRATGSRVVIMDQGYNRHMTGPRAHNWLELEQMVLEAKAEHDGALAA